MNILKASSDYEGWLSRQLKIDPKHLLKKHENMRSSAFVFLRATYYRWAQIFAEACPELEDGPRVLAVADLHIENFGTWRDLEGRLIWGINDFDESCTLPYGNDLVRLSTSANLAINENHLRLKLPEACEAILAGYIEGFTHGGLPFVLEESQPELRGMALSKLRDPTHFWRKLDDQCSPAANVPVIVRKMLRKSFPEKASIEKIAIRQAGQGSLGRQRFVAHAYAWGARIAREAKALAPSAYFWANPGKGRTVIFYSKILKRAIRCPDPFLKVKDNWVIRRLAPDCSRIDLSAFGEAGDQRLLLQCMGRETANIHLGSPKKREDILADLKTRHHMWLQKATETMTKKVQLDAKYWRRNFKETQV